MCIACQATQYDQGAADAFADRMMQQINGSAAMLMLSIGHRTGLFDAMEDGQAYSSGELAAKAEMNERYVREWLGAMATARILQFDPSQRRYRLPAEHAAFLTRAATPNNMSATAQWFAVLGAVEDEVVAAFSHGKGVPYSAYRRFPQVMAEESNQTTVSALLEHIVPLIPCAHERLSAGARAIDIGCGTGRAMLHLARQYPNSEFHGLDLLPEQIETANAEAREMNLKNISFRAADVTRWDEPETYDMVFTFDAVHDQARPDLVLRNIARALRPDGHYLMQDIKASSFVERNMEHPLATFIYTISCMHCMSVSLANGGMGLGAAWGKELAMEMLDAAGLQTVQVYELPHDIMNLYYLAAPKR